MSPSSPKIILITGCSSGFGLQTAARLATHGHKVFATMRDLRKQNALLSDVNRRGGGEEVTVLPLDVTDRDSIREAVGKIAAKHGYIDALINNAGYGLGGFFEDLTEKEIREQMETNFFGLQNVTREVIPLMRSRKKGRIINISSVSGFYATPAFGAYNVSKWAVEAFSESLYYELKPFGIDVLLIEPGVYKTNIFYREERYCKNFDNKESPYYEKSQHLKKRVLDHVEECRKDLERIAALVEKLIETPRPSFRNIPDMDGRILYVLRKLLPFRLFSWIIQAVLFHDFQPARSIQSKI